MADTCWFWVSVISLGTGRLLASKAPPSRRTSWSDAQENFNPDQTRAEELLAPTSTMQDEQRDRRC